MTQRQTRRLREGQLERTIGGRNRREISRAWRLRACCTNTVDGVEYAVGIRQVAGNANAAQPVEQLQIQPPQQFPACEIRVLEQALAVDGV